MGYVTPLYYGTSHAPQSLATGPVEYVSTLPSYPAYDEGWPMAHSALREDSSLYVVPGSHRVPRTPAQRAMSSNTIAPIDPLTMPGAIRVTLKRTSDDICTPIDADRLSW